MELLRKRPPLPLLALLFACASALSGYAETPAARFWTALEAGLQSRLSALPTWTAPADTAARRFLAGGRLWVGGSAPDFAAEATYRAGGLMPIESLSQADSLGPFDVGLLSTRRPIDEDILIARKLRQLGALPIGFGSRVELPELVRSCAFWIDTDVTLVREGTPLSAILNIADLWAFTGEFIAACTRQGQMPTVWQSIMIPGSQERNERYRPQRLHTDRHPRPVPPTVLGTSYLSALRKYLADFRKNEWSNLQMAVDRIRQTRASGRRALVLPNGGHLRPNLMDQPGTVPDLEDLPGSLGPEELQWQLREGDFLYIIGYTDPPADLIAAADTAGAFVVLSLAGRDGNPPARDTADLVIDAQWQLGDAAVPLPGYDVPLLPPSGFMGAAIYWALVLEAQTGQY